MSPRMIYDDLREKVVLITGASGGIGQAAAYAFASQGCKLSLTGRNQTKLDALAADVQLIYHADVLAQRADIQSSDEVNLVIQRTLEAYQTIDVLIANAGTTRDNLVVRMKDGEWQEVIDTELTGQFYCVRAVLPAMLRQRSGSIIMTGSVVGRDGNVGQANHAAAKAGLVGMAKSLAQEYGSRGIRVNVVSPGYIETQVTAGIDEGKKQVWISRTPLGRPGTPEEVAAAYLFLASAQSSFITGQQIGVDGGFRV